MGLTLRDKALKLAVATAARRVPQSLRFPLQREGVDPVPRLEESRARGDVVRLARLLGTRVWLVTGYDAARAMLADSDAFANDVRHIIGRQDRAPAERIGGLGMTDSPDHERLRRVLTPYFTRRRLADLQADIDRVVADALDDMAAHGPEVDLVERFGFAVPFGVICDLLGMPAVDREEFRKHGAARFDLRDGGARLFDTAAGTREFLIDLVGAERRSPHLPDGLVSRMVADHGADFDDVELGGLADGVFLGGYETSASMLSLGTWVLLQHPTSWDLLRRGEPADVDRVVEELLRFVCPVQVAFPRIARRDVMVGEQQVRAGDVVVVSLTGVERDPARHVDPARFDPMTASAGTLAFGHGLHRCVGAELARMELRTALVALARRFPDLSLACDPADLEFTELAVVHGVESLPVRLGDSRPARTLDQVVVRSVLLAAALVAAASACAADEPRRPGSTQAPAERRTTSASTPTTTPSLTPTPEPTESATPEPTTPEPRRSFVTIPAIGLRDFAVVRYRGSPDDAPGTAFQNAGEMASPRGARGGVGPGEVGNFIVTGHRLTGTAPLRYSPSLQRGDRIRVRSGDTVFVYEVRRTRWTSFRQPRSLRAQRAPVPGRIGEVATEPMITLSTCATLEDHAVGNYWSDEFDNPEHRLDKIGVLVATRPA